MRTNRTRKVDFSEQDIVDSIYQLYYNMINIACRVGDPYWTIHHIIKHGIALESDYPYVSSETNSHGGCKHDVYRQPFTLNL